MTDKALAAVRKNSPSGPSGLTPKKRGRKRGKHSDESYTQTSIYLPIELRNRVRAKLYERGMEMSGLVEQMLREWLHSSGGGGLAETNNTEIAGRRLQR